MIAACRAGKDVYLEKPLGNSIGEGPVAIEAARKYDRIVQVGTQQRSQQHYREAVELIQAGKLGEISEVRVWDYENYFPGPGSPADTPAARGTRLGLLRRPLALPRLQPEHVLQVRLRLVPRRRRRPPGGLGRAPLRHRALGHGSEVAEDGLRHRRQLRLRNNHDYPNTFNATVEFGPGPVAKRGFVLHYTMRTGNRRETRSHGKAFFGTDASMVLDRAGYSIVRELSPGAKFNAADRFINAEETVRAQDDHLYPFEVFLDNIRSRKQPDANLETCHQATALGHLMNISWEVGRSIRWDGAKNRVIGDAEAQAKVFRPYRAPWKLEV